jgi:hypothetical protein
MGDKADFKHQRKPHGVGGSIHEMVRSDLYNRKLFGEVKYGEHLKANNGRNCLQDAYEEMLDMTCYMKQKLVEEASNPFGANKKMTDNLTGAVITMNCVTFDNQVVYTVNGTGNVFTSSVIKFINEFTEIPEDA